MTTDNNVVKVYVDPDIEDWLATLPESASKSSEIQKMVRAGLQATAIFRWNGLNIEDEVKGLKRILAAVLLDQKVYETQLKTLEATSSDLEDNIQELTDWKQSFAKFDLFEDLETETIKASLEVFEELGAGVMEAVEKVPKLEQRIDELDYLVRRLLEERDKAP